MFVFLKEDDRSWFLSEEDAHEDEDECFSPSIPPTLLPPTSLSALLPLIPPSPPSGSLYLSLCGWVWKWTTITLSLQRSICILNDAASTETFYPASRSQLLWCLFVFIYPGAFTLCVVVVVVGCIFSVLPELSMSLLIWFTDSLNETW